MRRHCDHPLLRDGVVPAKRAALEHLCVNRCAKLWPAKPCYGEQA
jgi:hypothetical protein